MKILLVEDDSLIGQAIRTALKQDHYAVDWCRTAGEALHALATHSYELMLLDIGLPDLSGLEMLKRQQSRSSSIATIIISARDGVDDRITGLDLGASDYVVKPFDLNELKARIRAVLRRQSADGSVELVANDLVLNTATCQATRSGQTEALTQREYALLFALMNRPGRILSRDRLIESLYDWQDDISSNTIEFIIHGIRKKLGKDVIINVRGLGWMVEK